MADEWHSDLTFQGSPALMSVLHMKRCPFGGGDTMWSSLTAAYEALSEPMKAFLQGLTALHDALPHNRPDKMTIHPVIRRHPESGLPALYVNEHFTRRIVELGAEESEVLLRHLTRWVQQPRFTVRYAWTEGTIAFWDNRATQHFVLNDFEGERVIQRVTVQGDRVEPLGSRTGRPIYGKAAFRQPPAMIANSRYTFGPSRGSPPTSLGGFKGRDGGAVEKAVVSCSLVAQ